MTTTRTQALTVRTRSDAEIAKQRAEEIARKAAREPAERTTANGQLHLRAFDAGLHSAKAPPMSAVRSLLCAVQCSWLIDRTTQWLNEPVDSRTA